MILAGSLVPLIGFIYGSIIGSFLNVVSLRYINRLSTGSRLPQTLGGRSLCPHCRRQLRWWELIPLISFVILRGRCRQCRKRISWQYPVVELLMGAAVWQLLRQHPDPGSFILLSSMAALLLVLAVIDYRTFLLPDRYIIMLSVIAGLIVLYEGRPLVGSAAGVAAGAGFLLLLWLVTRGQGIGLGDVKLMIPLGALFGFPAVVLLLFLAFCSGGLLGIVLLARRTATLKTAVPFGPFLIGAAFVLLLRPDISSRFFALF